MKTKHIIYPAVLVLGLLVPTMRYYASTPELNACVSDYIDQMQYSNNRGVIYNIEGRVHIEPENSELNKALKTYLVGRSNGCMMYSNNILNDLNNTIYCSVTYMIKHAPIHNNAKKQLSLLKKP